jgi:TonB family protein
VLAPEDDGSAMEAPRFSLAADIVELVVLTTDEIFLQTLREAVDASRRLWHVPSPDKVSDLLIAGGVGVLVLDVQALHETANVFIAEIKRQFPDLVIVVAGGRETETGLARLISEGTVYRFIHKPMSPGRARLFADAAVKKFDEQRKRGAARVSVAPLGAPANKGLLLGTAAAACALLGAIFLLRQGPVSRSTTVPEEHAATLHPAGAAAVPAAALPSNGGELARAENALLEDRLDEAATAIEAARKAGVESGRIFFLTAQLAKARDQQKAALAQSRQKPAPAARPDVDRAAQLASLAQQRIDEQHLIDPDGDSASYYVSEALRVNPASEPALAAQQALALGLLGSAKSAIDRRDFARAEVIIAAASGVAAAANVEHLQQMLAAARHQAEADTADQLLKSAQERLQQDRLVEPANDNAKFYLQSLRTLDATHAGLAAATQDLGARLVAKARRALGSQQYDAARGWLDEAASVGYSSPDALAARQELDASLAGQRFMADVVNANELTLVKSVAPVYPSNAEKAAIEGWVELDFTVSETGGVTAVSVRAANPSAVFEQAAIAALSQWRYKPMLHDGQPAAQRARIRIRFALAH